jgi:hypothetical protein
MNKQTGNARHDSQRHDQDNNEPDRADAARRSLDSGAGEDAVTFDPRGGEDPGLLELTEDPRERRLKRNTM